jgi:hypothetical protein
MSKRIDRIDEHLLGQAENRITELEEEINDLEKDMEDYVEERILELNAEGEAFDKECWDVLRQICEEQGLDWSDYPEGLTADGAYEYINECFADINT